MCCVESPFRRWVAGLVVCGWIAAGSMTTAQEFRTLAGMLPDHANAIVLLNVEKMLNSPYGQEQGWAESLDEAFRDGLARVPSSAEKVVLGGELDLEFVQPVWNAMLVKTKHPIDYTRLAKEQNAEFDKIDVFKALRMPTDAFAIFAKPDLVGVLSPANRQWALRWARKMQSGGDFTTLSPYLRRAASYSDEAGSEIIMALDLDGVVSAIDVRKSLEDSNVLEGTGLNAAQVAELLASVKGLRFGIRIGDKPSGMAAIDFGADATILKPVAKKLFDDLIDRAGIRIADFDQWQANTQGTEVTLSGYLSESGLRRVLSVIDSPETPPGLDAPVSPGDLAQQKAQNTLKYYRTVQEMFTDLERDWRNLKNVSSASVYFDRYAKRIEQLPILNVDPEMVEYGTFVAKAMRQCSGAVRTMGIRGNVRTSNVRSAPVGPYAYGSYRYGRYGYYYGHGYAGDWAVYDPGAELRAVTAERQRIMNQERGAMAANIFQIRDKVNEETVRIRQKMTEKYQMEF
ncbi:hypothetical protein [Thermostilla marina]